MRLRSKAHRPEQPARRPEADAETSTPDLAALDWRDLWGEFRRRGWVAIPEGAWDALEATVLAAEARAEQAVENAHSLVRVGLEYSNKAWDANRELARSESEARLLVHALAGDELDAIQHYENGDED